MAFEFGFSFGIDKRRFSLRYFLNNAGISVCADYFEACIGKGVGKKDSFVPASDDGNTDILSVSRRYPPLWVLGVKLGARVVPQV